MAHGLLLNQKEFVIDSLNIINYQDNKKLRITMGKNGRIRNTKWIRGIVLHTTKGWPDDSHPSPQLLIDGFGKNQNAGERCVEVWKDVTAGAHLVVDFDGAIYQCADLVSEATYHAGSVNEVTVGIEIYQGSKAELYQEQLNVVVKLLDSLTALLGIQRQYHSPYHAKQLPQRISSSQVAGKDVVGIYGHRDVTTNRTFGDPGDIVFSYLKNAGYESFDFGKNEDLLVWKERQKQLNITADGIPGPNTVKALQQVGYVNGLWVRR